MTSSPAPLVADDKPARSVEAAPPAKKRLPRAFVRHHRIVITVVLTALFIFVRLLWLDADPPDRLPNHAQVYELFSDPPAKSFEARNMALFGVWQTNDADNYQFWRLQAPVWVYPISWFYRAFGVGYPQMRTFSTLCAATGFFAMMLFAGKKLRGLPFLATGSFLAFNYYYIIYGRSGLIEALLNTWLVLTVFFIYLARRHLGWLLAAEVTLVLAFLTKMSGFYLLPILLAVGIPTFVAHVRAGAPRWLAIAPFALGGALCAFLAWYVLRDAYWRTVAWNYGHMLTKKDAVDTVEVRGIPLLDVLDRLRTIQTWTKGYILLFPVAGALAAIELFRIAYRGIRRKRWARWEVTVALWLLAGFGTLLFTPHLWVHFRLILFPPVVMLAGSLLAALARVRRARSRPWIAPAVAGASIAAALAFDGTWFAGWATHRTYYVTQATEAIRKAVGERDAVFAGMWAGPLLFDTRYKWYYIKLIFNQSSEAITSFGVTHLLGVDGDLTSPRLAALFPRQWATKVTMMEFHLRGREVSVCEFKRPLAK